MTIDNQIVEGLLEEAEIDSVTRMDSIVDMQVGGVNGTIDALWGGIQDKVPLTIQALKSRALDIFLVEVSPSESFTLYVFSEGGVYVGYRGPPPIEQMPAFAADLAVDLSVFYRIHNGWHEIDSGDGLLRVEDFEVFRDRDSGQPNFLKVFQKGVNSVGFDLDSEEKRPYVLWVEDEEVEEIIDFWRFIDEWLSLMLEAFEARAVK